MDYATQSSRVGARVPYSLLRGTASAAIYYHFVGGSIWLRQLVCPWHLSLGHIRVPTGIQRILQIHYNAT